MTAPDNYTSASGASYSFNNIPLGFAEAEAICNAQCGHLAAYPNLPEQNDVEQYYINRVGAADARCWQMATLNGILHLATLATLAYGCLQPNMLHRLNASPSLLFLLRA
jgi:hypothetical protein